MGRNTTWCALVGCLAAAFVVAGCGGGGPSHNGPGASTNYVRPIGFTAENLAEESAFLKTQFYWAGTQTGDLYEFRRTANGYMFVRYLTPPDPADKVGSTKGDFLTVATYRFPGAYAALKKQAKGHAVAGPDDSIIYVEPRDSRNVLMAFSGSPGVQVEIRAPTAANSLALARSGKIKPVR